MTVEYASFLTAREYMMRDLLVRIARAPGQSKWDIIGTVPSRTRARHYKMIDRLIKLGLVENAGTAHRYALHTTDEGQMEVSWG